MTLMATPNNQPPEDCLSLEGPDPPKQNETTPKTSPGSTPTFPNRRDSQYLTSSPISSHVFLIGFYEQILKAKSTHRFHELRESTQRALDLAKSEGFSRERAQLPHNLEVVLQPMLAACKTDSKTLTLIGLDGLSKLITYGYLSDQPLFSAKDARDCSPIEMAVLAICGCFKGEATEDKVQTQIIKGLMAAVASTTTVIHQEALLNAIRTLYNIFLLSRDVSNQTIAQGTLLQMSRSVFGRIEAPEPKTWPNSGKSLTFAASRTKFSDAPETSLPAFDEESDEDGPQEEPLADERLTLEALGGKAAEAAANAQAQGNLCDASSDLNVLDGFLLFRALCKLSIKPYQPDASGEVRSMSLRSKLLALYLILMLVTEFPEVFTTAKVYFLTDGHGPQPVREATFLTAIKPYFGLCLTRNLLATLPKIYELALATFEGVVETMRWSLKREVEVYLKEILIPNLESKPQGCQKHVLITMFLSKLCADPHMLVEFYLFYDCNRGSLNNNIFEHLTRALSKLATSIQTSQESPPVWEDADAFQAGAKLLNRGDLLNLPTLTSDRFTSGYIARSFFSRVTFTDPILQYRAMECLVAILKSLVKWSHRTPFTDVATPAHPGGEADSPVDPNFTPLDQGPTEGLTLQEGVDLFNRKPRKGIERLIKHGLIPSHQPHDVAQFLLTTPELSKVALGEFLGEADARNVEIMHALVDLLDFSGLELVPALRRLLQAFRLPGEALKADRLLLKFAERYTAQNPKAFASADAAYVLSYSAILLDADLHHPQLKRHTTLQEFINTTCGTDGGADFSEELLAGIYQHIASLAINLRDEAEVDIARPTLSNAELPRGCSLRRKSAYSASHVEHARSMFEACWMASLAAISELLKSRDESRDESRMVALCLDGFRSAIHLASFFDLDLARNALMTAISNFCFPINLREMGPRDLEVIRTMLDVAIEDGNYLRGSWADVLQIVNHLVRIQVIPNFTASTNGQDRSLVAHRDPHTLAEPTSQAMLIAVDKVFAYSVRLSGPAIVEFIRALSQIAVDELADLPSGFDCTRVPTSPKMFAIQKVVEVAYCNMNRIRLEWGEIWAVLGPTFGTLGCHANEAVGSFVVDSLRQLATKFLDLEELAHFQFQRQMLSPFVRIVGGSPTVAIQDTALQCLQHLVRTSAPHLKSGWKAISQALGAADRDAALVTRAFEMAKDLGSDHFEWVAANFDNFKAFLDCLAKFAKNPHFPKISLHAVEVYHFVTTRMVDFAASRGPPSEPSGSEFWVPVFEGQMEMVLEVKDLEVRTRAMDHLFAHLHRHGHGFAEPLWHHLLSQVLFPLFSTVGQPAKDKVAGLSYPDAYPDEAAVWVSTTLVHALRKFVRLFTEFFDKVFQFLDGLLDLLSVCLCQEDPALCRVGADCLRALIEDNIDRMSEDDWQRIVSIVIRLFRATSQVSQDPEVGLTLPTRANPSLERFEASSPLPLVPSSPAQQLSLCLSVIALVEEVFLQNDRVFLRLGPEHIFLILDVVERAYLETQRTNAAFDLAGAIERQSVSKLDRFANTALSLELACLVCLVKVLLKMYVSSDAAFEPYASQIHRRLVPLCRDSFKQFNALSEHPLTPGVQTIHRRWHQAVLRVGNFLSTATGPQFREIFGPLSSEAIRTLRHRHLSHEVQVMMYNLMERVDAIYIHPSR